MRSSRILLAAAFAAVSATSAFAQKILWSGAAPAGGGFYNGPISTLLSNPVGGFPPGWNVTFREDADPAPNFSNYNVLGSGSRVRGRTVVATTFSAAIGWSATTPRSRRPEDRAPS